jgi:hypothetical protein
MIRLPAKKHVYLLGVNNGEFPRSKISESYFSERDKIELSALGLATEADSEIKEARELFFFSRAFSVATDSVTILYSLRNESLGPSAPAEVIARLSYISGEVIKAKKIYLSHVYAFNSIEDFDVDADGVFRSKGNKKRYKVFLVLACIAFCSNTICAWSYSTEVAVWLSILELGCMVLSIVSFHLVDNLFLGYGPIKFTGPNESGTYDVVLIFDTLMNKLYTEEEYLKKYSFMK